MTNINQNALEAAAIAFNEAGVIQGIVSLGDQLTAAIKAFHQAEAYIVNPANIVYMAIWQGKDGFSKGTTIVFNAYAAFANEQDSHFEPLSIQIMGKTPVEVMDFLNDEPPY
jgi:hypothetical protein